MAGGECRKTTSLSRPPRVWGDGHRSVELRRGKEHFQHVIPRLLLYLAHPRAPPGISDLVWLTPLMQNPVSVGDIRSFRMVFTPYLRSIKVLDIWRHRESLGAELDKRIFTSPVVITSCSGGCSVI